MSSGESTNVLANAVGRNDRISVSVSLTEALSMVFTTESEQKRERKQHILLGEHKWCKRESPGLSPMRPGFNSSCRRSMWVKFVVGLSLLIHSTCSSCKEQKWGLHGVLTKTDLKKYWSIFHSGLLKLDKDNFFFFFHFSKNVFRPWWVPPRGYWWT